MKDRQVEYPGRMVMTDVDTDEEYTFDVLRAEGTITEAGTAYNVENVLSDETAEALGLTDEATPNDAFLVIAETLEDYVDANDIAY